MIITRTLSINPEEVSSLFITSSYYVSTATLTICMKNGDKHVIEHNPGISEQIDVYHIKAQIDKILEGKNNNVLLEGQ